MEFYIFDVYTALGMQKEAKDFYNRMVAPGHVDDFPRKGTHWFRDFFYPVVAQPRQGARNGEILQPARQVLPRQRPEFLPRPARGRVHPLHERRRRHRPEGDGHEGVRLASSRESEFRQAKKTFPQIRY
jgi:hypothetical protein